MNRFEDELKQALRREEPSSEFTDRLMARIAQENKKQKDAATDGLGWWQKVLAILQPPQTRWAMAGALASLMIVSFVGAHQYRQHMELQRQAEIAAEAEGQRAKEQVMFAMRIASAKLNVAQKKVKDSLQHDDGQPTDHQ